MSRWFSVLSFFFLTKQFKPTKTNRISTMYNLESNVGVVMVRKVTHFTMSWHLFFGSSDRRIFCVPLLAENVLGLESNYGSKRTQSLYIKGIRDFVFWSWMRKKFEKAVERLSLNSLVCIILQRMFLVLWTQQPQISVIVDISAAGTHYCQIDEFSFTFK